MTQSTADKVLAAWAQRVHTAPKQRGTAWRGISPLRSDAKATTSFVLRLDGPEHGAWKDWPTDRSGSLYELARELGVELPTVGSAPSTKRVYADLDAYAEAHGVTADVFTAAGWQETTHRDRRALMLMTATGKRWRYLDGNNPKYWHEPGYTRCWYGLKRAVDMATKDSLPLVLCNGEASTVVAQAYGIPACAMTGGENRLPDYMLTELQQVWTGDILLAYDCDDKGRATAQAVQAQLSNSRIIDLELENNGDLADLTRLWGKDTMKELMRRSRTVKTASVMLEDLYDDYIGRLNGVTVSPGKPLQIPFDSWRRFEGFADTMSPGKLMGIAGASGGGKTTMISTLSDLWAQAGEGGLWYGPEYDEQEMVIRRVGRYGGATPTQVRQHLLYLHDLQTNGPDGQLKGQLMDVNLMKRSQQIAQQLKSWTGKTQYFHSTRYLDQTLEAMGRAIQQRREAGEEVTYAVFDYAQLLRAEGVSRSEQAYEQALGLIKDFVMAHHIVGVVGSQVTKAATGEARDGGVIASHQTNWIREDKFNLIVTISLQYEEDARGNLVKTNRGLVNIAKNNDGLTGTLKMIANFRQFIWEDRAW